MTSETFPPTVIMEEGVVSAPIRFYASRTSAASTRRCEQLVVAISDIQPPPEMLNDLGRAILDWAETKGIQLVVAVEGQPLDEEIKGDARVVAMANRAAVPLLGKYHFDPANGVVTGLRRGRSSRGHRPADPGPLPRSPRPTRTTRTPGPRRR